jgi:O-antigen/teichoic acid export membrane protein
VDIKDKKEYSEILKSTFIFGSTQVFQMAIMLLRSKISAVLLGPTGVGIYSIFQTTVVTIGQLSSLGIFQSGIRELSKFNVSDSKAVLLIHTTRFKKLAFVLALLSILFSVLLAFPLSYFSFGSDIYTRSFMILSFAIFFYIMAQSQLTVLQSTLQARSIALSSLISSIISVIVLWLLFRYFALAGIVPSIILTFLIQYVIVSLFMTNDRHIYLPFSIRKTLRKSKNIIDTGIVLMVSVFLINIFSLILNGIISRYGEIDDVGLFYAAFALTNGNILILISILSSDYFPRLSACMENRDESMSLLNNQAELLCLIAAPLTIFLIIFSRFFVEYLFSVDFIVIVPMIKLMSLGLLFRIVWQSMSYVILAKGEKHVYFIYDALIGNGLVFVLNVFCYFRFGLSGLGFSFVFSSVIVSLILSYIVKRRYGVFFQKQFKWSFSIVLFLCLAAYYFSLIGNSIILILILLISVVFSIYSIFKRIGFNIFDR